MFTARWSKDPTCHFKSPGANWNCVLFVTGVVLTPVGAAFEAYEYYRAASVFKAALTASKGKAILTASGVAEALLGGCR